MAVPALERLMREMRLRSVADQFYTQVVTARSEAIRRGSAVFMCRTGDPLDLAGDGETPSCRAPIQPGGASLSSRDWSYGWLMYSTNQGFVSERDYNPGQGHVLIGVSDPGFQDRGVQITSNTTGNSWLSFQGDGTLAESGLLYYTICDDRGVQKGKLLTVFLDGETRLSDLPTSNVTTCTPPNT